MDRAAFIRSNTQIATPALVPEIRLHLATEITPIWQATEETLAHIALPPPFWAFAWAGGQALARHLLDHPDEVAGRFVVDFGAGSGLVAIAAAKAGAARVLAADIDQFAAAAIAANAALNQVSVEATTADLLRGTDPLWEVVTAGDVCYEQPMAELVAAWLSALAEGGRRVLLGDPGRAYLPADGLRELAKIPGADQSRTRRSRSSRSGRVGGDCGLRPERQRRGGNWRIVILLSRQEHFDERIACSGIAYGCGGGSTCLGAACGDRDIEPTKTGHSSRRRAPAAWPKLNWVGSRSRSLRRRPLGSSAVGCIPIMD